MIRNLCAFFTLVLAVLHCTNSQPYNVYSFLDPDQPANSLLGVFELPGFSNNTSILLLDTAYYSNVSFDNGTFTLAVYTVLPTRLNDESLVPIFILDGTVYDLIIYIRTIPLPILTYNNVTSLAELYYRGVEVSVAIRPPGTALTYANASSMTTAIGTPTANRSSSNTTMVSLELPANMSVSKEKNIQPVMNLVDNSKGQEILLNHKNLADGTYAVNFTAVHNSKCVHHLSLEIQYPVCNSSELRAPINGIIGNETHMQVDDKRMLLKVDYACDDGFEADGSLQALCVNDSVFQPSTPPNCTRVICQVPHGYCSNAEIVNSSLPYDYQAKRNIVCRAGFRLVNGAADGTSVCEANRSSSVACPQCEAIPCNSYDLQLPQFANTEIVAANQSVAVGANISVDCLTGYNLNGRSSLVCQLGPDWSAHNSTCEIVDCGPPPMPANSNFTGMNFTYSQYVNYTCDPAYEQMSGSSFLQCAANGTWAGDQIVCKAIPCNSSDIQLPQFANSGIVTANQSVAVGANISFDCLTGHNLNGRGSFVCLLGPVWSAHNSTCEIVDCGPPPMPANSNFTGMNFTYSQYVNYTCDPAYEQMSGSSFLQCAANGSWTGEQIVCTAIPCNSSDIQLPQLANTGSVTASQSVAVGASISFNCETGYNLNGSGTVVCQLGPEWSAHNSTCEIVDCGPPPMPANSTFTGMNFTYSQYVNYTCDPAYEQMSGSSFLQCAANGTWAGEQIVCKAKPCNSNEFRLTVDIELFVITGGVKANQLFAVGEIITIACRTGYNLLGSGRAMCQHGQVWSPHNSTCEKVHCGEPPTSANSYFTGTNFTFLGIVSFSCNQTFNRKSGSTESRCGPDGKWTGETIVCKGIITFAKAWRNKCFRALFVSICILIFLASIFLAFAIRRHIGVKRPAATKVKKPQPKVEEGPYRRQTMPHLQICSDQVLNDHYVDNSGFTVANPSEFAMVSISTSSPDSVHI